MTLRRTTYLKKVEGYARPANLNPDDNIGTERLREHKRLFPKK